jgi:mannose-6-phosphate isomerase-like protein (cupin superfamily)
MLIKEKDLSSIKENKVTLVKNFINLERNYDFNLLSNIIDENQVQVISHTFIGNLKDIFQIPSAMNYIQELKIFFDFFRKLLRYEIDSRDEVDLYFSFTSQIGSNHIDPEDVYIIGLKGKTIYRIFNTNNEVNEGDLIFIPRGIKHKAIGTTPRIIASIGYYGKKNVK